MEKLQLTSTTKIKKGSSSSNNNNNFDLPSIQKKNGENFGQFQFNNDIKMDSVLGSFQITDTFSNNFIPVEQHTKLLSKLMQSYVTGMHLLLIGGKGSGKSILAKELGSRLGYEIETFSVYNDMTSRY